MSDRPNPLTVLQQRMQQRQILAMMGINQWVQPDSPTTHTSDIAVPTASAPTIDIAMSETDIVPPSVLPSAGVLDTAGMETQSAPIDKGVTHYHHDVSESSPVAYHFDSHLPSLATTESTQPPPAATLQQPATLAGVSEGPKKTAPFDLQGGAYGDWVVLVDIQALNNDSQKLWDNITQALSIKCETTSFPICAGMDTAELACASFAGYVFKIGRSEAIKIAALTALPDGLEHPKLTSVPTLDEMLVDGNLKRQFWGQLSRVD